MLADVVQGHGGDGGSDDRPPTHYIPTGCGVASLTEAKAPENLIWVAGKRAGCIRARRPGTSCPGGAEGGDLGKDWGSDISRTLPWQIGMPSLPFGIIPGTKLEPLKIAKTRQRARSYAGRDPSHLLAFEIKRWRAQPLESTRR
ncbi:hypothetical protein Tco_0260226 [Tanacetum coccineum]